MSELNRRSLLAGAIAAGGAVVLATTASGATARPTSRPATDEAAPGRSRNTLGKILYIGPDDKERGREWFGITYRQDDQITLRAYNEIDDTRVERDVVQTMRKDYSPLDCFVRLHVGGKFLGTGWIRITDTEAECEVFSTLMGRVHQRVPLTERVRGIVSHPVSSDALLLTAFDHSKPERLQSVPGGLSTSPLADGGSGPFLNVPTGRMREFEYIGPERVTTRAGTFDTHHYSFGPRVPAGGSARAYEVWCTHPDYIFVRGEVRNYLSKTKDGYGRYELVELKRE
ncbi:MAG: hypothetical protein ABI859_11375 [Pseudomonadota bacterium]